MYLSVICPVSAFDAQLRMLLVERAQRNTDDPDAASRAVTYEMLLGRGTSASLRVQAQCLLCFSNTPVTLLTMHGFSVLEDAVPNQYFSRVLQEPLELYTQFVACLQGAVHRQSSDNWQLIFLNKLIMLKAIENML